MHREERSPKRGHGLAGALLGALLVVCAAAHTNGEVVDVRVYNVDFSAAPAGEPVLDPTITIGDTIRWVWESGFHDTTSAAGQAESWASETTSQPGFTFEHTFTQTGVFHYYCSVHGQDDGDGTASGMAGTITVGGGGPQYFFGLPHEALGMAELADDGAGHLVVSNIGSSGKDGVSIDLGETDGWQAVMPQGMDPAVLPPGA